MSTPALRCKMESGIGHRFPLYQSSCVELTSGCSAAMVKNGPGRSILLAAGTPAKLVPTFHGQAMTEAGLSLKLCPLDHANADALRQELAWTAPVSLRRRQTTIGCGDRLGRATPGHIRAVRGFQASPVLAQQSIRELNLTGRTYANVVDDATFLVFQEGYRDGFGADGDHLKTIADINMAIDAGMAMITLDLSEVMLAAAQNWSEEQVDAAFAELAAEQRERILSCYAGRDFLVGGATIFIPTTEAKRCAVMYLAALDFARDVHELLKRRRGNAFDLEISVDETTAPTLPSHHLFIIREILQRQIEISSLAPRFIGEFQKAVDYIGDLAEFERQFAVHCAIAKEHGDYKISIHSGSDKFSVYPVIGRHTGLRVHVKTAGTSWLEALRAIATAEPALFRDMHRLALATFPQALKYYHVTPDMTQVPAADELTDGAAAALLDQDASRQVLHVTYGTILADPAIRGRFFQALLDHEQTFWTLLERHFIKHLSLLGVGVRAG